MRALRRTRRWQFAALALLTLGTSPLIGCDALQPGAIKGDTLPAKPGLKLTIQGDFSPLRQSEAGRFGRIEIRAGDKLPAKILRRADLAAALKGTKPIEGVSISNTELIVGFSDLEPGDYQVTVVLYDQAEGGTKLSDNTFTRTLAVGVLEAVKLDLSAAIGAANPQPSPSPTPTSAPTDGDLAAGVDLVGDGDGQAHPVTLDGTLPAHFGMPTTSGTKWVYDATQSIYLNATDTFTTGATRTVEIVTGGEVRYSESYQGGSGSGPFTLPDLTYVGSTLRHFGSLGDDSLQATGATRSFTIGSTTYVGEHFVLTSGRFADEDPSPNWPAPLSTHTFDLWYAQGVGLLESQDTVYLSDGRVKAGQRLRLRTFQAGL